MSKRVVKDNALIEASYTLDVAEQRVILLAILEAREQKHLSKQEAYYAFMPVVTFINLTLIEALPIKSSKKP